MVTTTIQAQQVADRELERRVTNALVSRNFPGLRRLSVEADRGRVALRGRVRSFYEKQLAQHVVRHVPGVLELIETIDVLAPARPQLGWRWAVSPEVSALLSTRDVSG